MAEVAKPGSANVHCDPLHFLVEYGILGGVLGAAIVAFLLRPWARLRRPLPPLVALGGAGLGLVVLFSLFDLPFRCPGVLWTWVALAIALPAAGEADAAAGTATEESI
jgi:O-antigen ligase